MKKLILLLASTLSLVATTPRSPAVAALNGKEVVFLYSRPDTNTCTWSVSQNSGYYPPVADVFSNPTDTGTAGARYYIVGAGTALTASLKYYWRQVCGSETYTGSFTTPPLAVVPVTGGTAAWSVQVNLPLGADSVFWEVGTTPALGTTSTVICQPRCVLSGTKTGDSVRFFRYTFQNSTVNVGTVSSIQLIQ